VPDRPCRVSDPAERGSLRMHDGYRSGRGCVGVSVSVRIESEDAVNKCPGPHTTLVFVKLMSKRSGEVARQRPRFAGGNHRLRSVSELFRDRDRQLLRSHRTKSYRYGDERHGPQTHAIHALRTRSQQFARKPNADSVHRVSGR